MQILLYFTFLGYYSLVGRLINKGISQHPQNATLGTTIIYFKKNLWNLSLDSGCILHVKSLEGKPQNIFSNLHQNVDMTPPHDILNNLLRSKVGVLLCQRGVVHTLPPINVRHAYSVKVLELLIYLQVASSKGRE